MLDRVSDAAGEIAAIGVMPDLGTVTEDVQRVLPLQNLLDEVRHDVAHGELDIARHDLLIAERAALADADAVERADDRERQLVLVVCRAGEVLDRELLEAVGRQRRRALPLLALVRGPRLR